MVKIQQRGLGKGLSALISENYAPSQPTGGDGEVEVLEKPQAALGREGAAQELRLSSIVPGRFQPRARFSEEQLRELSISIQRNGVVQPIIVRAIERDGRTIYEIVAGERRWRAAGMAGLTTIPAIVRTIGDQQALELALIENVQRSDLTPLEEANGYQRLLEEFGYTQEELSGIVGKSRSHITNLLRLLSLPDDIRQLLDDGKLTMGHARALLTARNAADIARAIIDKGLSVRQAEALARESHGVSRQTRPRGRHSALEQLKDTVDALGRGEGPAVPKDPDILALEETLSESLGMQVMISDRGQGGDINIRYESFAQLDSLLRRLSG